MTEIKSCSNKGIFCIISPIFNMNEKNTSQEPKHVTWLLRNYGKTPEKDHLSFKTQVKISVELIFEDF